MTAMLPRLPDRSGTGRISLRAFGGLERRAGAGPGALSAMENLCGADAPLLATRPPRRSVRALTKPHGLVSAAGRLFSAEGTKLFADGVEAGTVSDADKAFAALGARLLVFPDKLVWSAADGLQPLEASYTASGLVFSDGTYAGESAEANSLTTAGDAFPFRVGDAVTIPACAPTGGAEKTAVVREVSADGKTLRFYEHTFDATGTVSDALTLTRSVPDLDFLCVCDNRVWGCRGDTVRCCKLGDPYNWNVFDGLSTDAWSCETGTPGDFTGCVSFLGYPVFFKEDRVFKVYGSRPSNFELTAGASLGVLPGAHGTLAAAGEALCYLSRAGFVRYGGGFPAPVGEALGDVRYTGGAAGGDGSRYTVSAQRADGTRETLVYDTQTGLWHREDALAAKALAFHDGALYAQTADALLCLRGGTAGTAEGSFTGSVTLADLGADQFAGKYPRLLRVRMERAAPVTVEISYDGGPFGIAATLPAGDGTADALAVPIRRCGRFSLRLSGAAPWRLKALDFELRSEAKPRKGG